MDALIYKDTIYGGGGAMRGNYFDPIIYSTEERVVGVWVDNKPLYQKTVIKSGSISQRETIPLGIANVENIFLVSDASSVNGIQPLPLVTGTDNSNNIGGFFDIQQSDTSFLFRIGSGMVGYVDNAIITVQYTKTTDVAGSGKYNTLGVPNVHYTTDEQVIGTWLTGKPLYKKTLQVTLDSTDFVVDLSSLNIMQITSMQGYMNVSDNTWVLHYPYYDSDRYYSVGEYNNTTKEFHIASSSNMVSQYPYVTFSIEYTKTTD